MQNIFWNPLLFVKLEICNFDLIYLLIVHQNFKKKINVHDLFKSYTDVKWAIANGRS